MAPRQTVLGSVIFAALFLLSAASVNAATLYLSPATGTFTTGKNFTVSVRVNTDQSMNAADGIVHFPTDKVQVIGVSKTGSVFNLWVQDPSYSNSGTLGNVRFEGVVLNPGFTGDGKIMDITFQVRGEGSANAVFASGSVLANDGQGTNIVTSMSGGTYALQKSAIPPPEGIATVPPRPLVRHFIQAVNGDFVIFNTSDNGIKWADSPSARLVWNLLNNVTGVSVVLNTTADSIPPTKSDGLFDVKNYNNIPEGRNYFHVRLINNQGAGGATHYPLFVDLTPPTPFKIKFTNRSSDKDEAFYASSGSSISIEFYSSDSLSGIDNYQIRVDDGDWIKTNVPANGGTYVLRDLAAGPRQIIVRAIDKAGNFTEATSQVFVEPVIAPTIVEYTRHLTSPGEKFFAEGTAAPKASVELRMSRSVDAPIVVSVTADDSGNWNLAYDGVFKSGSYKLTAKQKLTSGAESLETAPVRFSVNSLFWRLVFWLLNIGGLLLLALTIIAILLAMTYYYWHKVNNFRKRLRREAKQAEETLHRGVAVIKKELERGEPRSTISKDLSRLDKELEKDLKDIEKE